MTEQTKAVVTVAEMARMVGLSRARFYQLVQAGVFPMPVYNVSNRRPIYVEDLQKVCLEVRRRNYGINGKPVLFYTQRHRLSGQAKPLRKTNVRPKATERHADLIDALRGLGLAAVKAERVEAALKHLYPSGVEGHDEGQVIRSVFLFLKRQDSDGNVGG